MQSLGILPSWTYFLTPQVLLTPFLLKYYFCLFVSSKKLWSRWSQHLENIYLTWLVARSIEQDGGERERKSGRVGYAGMNTITRGMRRQPFAPVHSGKFSAITQEIERKQGCVAPIHENIWKQQFKNRLKYMNVN